MAGKARLSPAQELRNQLGADVRRGDHDAAETTRAELRLAVAEKKVREAADVADFPPPFTAAQRGNLAAILYGGDGDVA